MSASSTFNGVNPFVLAAQESQQRELETRPRRIALRQQLSSLLAQVNTDQPPRFTCEEFWPLVGELVGYEVTGAGDLMMDDLTDCFYEHAEADQWPSTDLRRLFWLLLALVDQDWVVYLDRVCPNVTEPAYIDHEGELWQWNFYSAAVWLSDGFSHSDPRITRAAVCRLLALCGYKPIQE